MPISYRTSPNADRIYNNVLDAMDEGLLASMKKVLSPQKVSFKALSYAVMMKDDIRQAIVLKLVRLISGLRAARLLAEHRFVQKSVSLQYMFDEITERIEFLSCACISG